MICFIEIQKPWYNFEHTLWFLRPQGIMATVQTNQVQPTLVLFVMAATSPSLGFGLNVLSAQILISAWPVKRKASTKNMKCFVLPLHGLLDITGFIVSTRLHFTHHPTLLNHLTHLMVPHLINSSLTLGVDLVPGDEVVSATEEGSNVEEANLAAMLVRPSVIVILHSHQKRNKMRFL